MKKVEVQIQEQAPWWKSIVKQFIELLKESVLVQAFISGVITFVIGYMFIAGRGTELTKEFWMMSGAIYGYYFKAKNDNQIRQLIKARRETEK